MKSEATSYTDRSPWPGFAHAILWGVLVLVCYPILAGIDMDVPIEQRLLLVGALVSAFGVLAAAIAGLSVRVQQTRLFLHIGRVPLIKRIVPYNEIVSIESVTYRPLREFGGWGVRGVGKRKAWTSRGHQAVKLELTGDRELLVGSDHPLRLEERLRTVAGDQLGSAS